MASLVLVTKEGRIFLKIGGVILGIILLIYFTVKGGALMQSVFFPKPPPPPQEALGKLPHIAFPTQGTQGLQFTVNTVNGLLPPSCYPVRCVPGQIPNRINVYKLLHSEPNLLALQDAKSTLQSEYFVNNQTKISDILYQWTQEKTGVTIEYNIVTKNFTIFSNFLTNPFLASTGLMPDETEVARDITNFLHSIGANTTNIDTSKTKVEYLQLQNGALIAAENLGTAKFARITLHQMDVDNIPIIYNTPTDSILTFIISYPSGNFDVLDGQFFDHQPDTNQKSDYPVKTAEQAFEDLKAGSAYMINPQNLTNIDITNVELKYYLNKDSSEYLLPVIVFTGINFSAYVEAIPNESLAN